jgi:hypothetical protein
MSNRRSFNGSLLTGRKSVKGGLVWFSKAKITHPLLLTARLRIRARAAPNIESFFNEAGTCPPLVFWCWSSAFLRHSSRPVNRLAR